VSYLNKLLRLGIILFFAGIVVSMIGILVATLGSTGSMMNISTGFCVVILFIPICYGSGPMSSVLIVIALALSLGVILILVMLILVMRRHLMGSGATG